MWPGIGPVTPVAPGMYTDQIGNMHIDVGEIIRVCGAEDTVDNRALVIRRLVEEVRAP